MKKNTLLYDGKPNGSTTYKTMFGHLYLNHVYLNLGLVISIFELRFGHLNAMIFRACRLVVDTGLHAFGWSRYIVHNLLKLSFDPSIVSCKKHNVDKDSSTEQDLDV